VTHPGQIFCHAALASVGYFTVAGLWLLVAEAIAQPVPIRTKPARTAYEETAPPMPAAPRTDEWRPIVRQADGYPPRTRYMPLPPGVVSCSISPTGREVCGSGVWLSEER